MAGSYQHMVTRSGRLRGNESFTGMIENLGDAYEAAQECYGMIWYLADVIAGETLGRETTRGDRIAIIEEARQHYRAGLRLGGVSGQRS